MSHLHRQACKFVKDVKHEPHADRPDRAPAANRTGAVPAGVGHPARHLRQLPQPDRARPARRHRLPADQAGGDAAGRSRRTCPARRSVSSRSACARPSPTRCSAPTTCRRGGRSARRQQPRTRRARCWRCTAPGGWRGRMPAASRCRPAGASCCRTRRRGTSSTTTPTISPRWKTPPKRSPHELGPGAPAEMNHAIAERLRTRAWGEGDGAAAGRRAAPLRPRDPQPGAVGIAAARKPRLPHGVPTRAAGGAGGGGGGAEARRPVHAGGGMLIRIGLLNYIAGGAGDALRAVPRRRAGAAARHGGARRALRRLVRAGVPPAVHLAARRCARGVPFFFLRVDPAGNVSKRFSAAGFPFARFGGSCPRWVVHTAFAQPGHGAGAGRRTAGWRGVPVLRPAVAQPAARWGEPRPTHVVAMGCALAQCRRCGLCRRPGPGREPGSASACPAGCATAPTAAAERFRRWSTGCRWTR